MKSIVIHLVNVAQNLDCFIDFSNPEIDKTVTYMMENATQNGYVHCPCDASGKTFCPCKEWVQKVKLGDATTGDKCHCEVFEKV
jgi:ferredoxin-thioredoxin reductase catalytic subunit